MIMPIVTFVLCMFYSKVQVLHIQVLCIDARIRV